MRESVLFTGVVAAALVLSGVRAYADDAVDIEQNYPNNSYVQYDDASGDFPVITVLASQPGTFGGHMYTSWQVLAQDSTGSLNLFITDATLKTLTQNPSASIAVGDKVSVAGQWSQYHQIPEIIFSTVPALNDYFVTESTGNGLPTPPVFTVSQLNVNNISNNINMAGFYLEIQNATLSGSIGGFQTTFPTYAQATTANMSYTITDNTGSMTMFDWVTEYSACGALGGTAVPTGPINAFGFVSYNTGGGPAEFTMLSYAAALPLVTLTPDSGAPGATITVQASGYTPGESVVVKYNSVQVATSTADGAGNVSGATFTVPSGNPPRTYNVTVTGQTSGLIGTAPFTQIGPNSISSITRSGNNIIIQIPSVADASYQYQLQVTPSLNPPTWTNLGAPQSGTGGVLTFTDIGGAANPARYYRIEISWP
jgi:hypothetical protein